MQAPIILEFKQGIKLGYSSKLSLRFGKWMGGMFS
jgi:hypothetical protein